MAKEPAVPKTLYRVRQGFVAHLVDGDPVEGGEELRLTEEEAKLYAAQIELVDEDTVEPAPPKQAK